MDASAEAPIIKNDEIKTVIDLILLLRVIIFFLSSRKELYVKLAFADTHIVSQKFFLGLIIKSEEQNEKNAV